MLKQIAFVLLAILVFSSPHIRAQNTELSEGFVFDGEPYLIVHPQNAQNLVVAWMGFAPGNAVAIHYRSSMDGGETWTEPAFIPHTVSGFTSADPSMAFDADGKLFLSYIDYAPDGSTGAVHVVNSMDGGISWSGPVEVIHADDDLGEFPVDRPWMAIDRSDGSYSGNIYINTKPAPWEPIPNKSYFIRSENNGLSFNDWSFTDSPGWSVGEFIAAPMACPTVNSNGELFIIYPGWEISENVLPRLMLASSYDGGESFVYSEVYEDDNTVEDTLPKRGYSLYANPANAYHLFFLFMADYLGDLDVYGIETWDKGASWTAPFRINNDEMANGNMQDLAWAAFNANGDLLVTWRDRRYSGLEGYENTTEIWGRRREKDADFGEEFLISSMPAAHQEVLNGNGNDFMCNALVADTMYAVWGDTRDAVLRIWLAKKVLGDSSVHITQLNENPIFLCYPNPADGQYLNVQFHGTDKGWITNSSGQIIERVTLKGTTTIDLQNYPKGVYYIETDSGLKTGFVRH